MEEPLRRGHPNIIAQLTSSVRFYLALKSARYGLLTQYGPRRNRAVTKPTKLPLLLLYPNRHWLAFNKGHSLRRSTVPLCSTKTCNSNTNGTTPSRTWIQVAPLQFSFAPDESSLIGEASHLMEQTPDGNGQCCHAWHFQATARHSLVFPFPFPSVTLILYEFTVYMIWSA